MTRLKVLALACALAAASPLASAEQTLSPKVGKPLQQAKQLTEAKKFKEAMAKVREAQAIGGKTAYEEAVVNQFTAYVATSMGDFATAADASERALPGAPAAELPQRLASLAQLNYKAKRYAKAEQFGKRYLKEVGASTDIALLVAQAQYLQANYAGATSSAQALLQMATKAGKPVQEDWLVLLRSAQHKAGNTADAATTLEQLLAIAPKPQYWQDLFSYREREMRGTDHQTLALLRLKRATGQLDAKGLTELAELSLASGLPGNAQSALEQISKTSGQNERGQRLLNMAKTQATEDQASLPAQLKQAQAAPGGDALVAVGAAYLSYGKPADAVQAIQAGIAKGSLKAPDEAQLQLGEALYAAGNKAQATTAFRKVPASSKLVAAARLWALLAGH